MDFPRVALRKLSSSHRLNHQQSLPRACKTSLWQPDYDAKKCSMKDCSTVFSNSIFINGYTRPSQSRHHCRLCGRVVCGSCSTGRRVLLPAAGASNAEAASMQRVCDCCSNNQSSFHFNLPTRDENVSGSVLNFRRSSTCSSLDDITPETSALILEQFRRTSVVDIPGSKMQPPFIQVMKNQSPVSNSSDDFSHTTASFDEDDEDGWSEADTASRAESAPKCSPQASKKDLNKTFSQDDERLAELENKLRTCDFYEGMVEHEPAAMRALLYFTLGLVPLRDRQAVVA